MPQSVRTVIPVGSFGHEPDGGGGGGGELLETVTVLDAAVAWLPAASRATAVRTCDPLEAPVVFHEIEYGDVVSSAPRLAPSSLNCTPATPTLSEAVAETVTAEPETVAPAAGALSATVGAVVSDGGGGGGEPDARHPMYVFATTT